MRQLQEFFPPIPPNNTTPGPIGTAVPGPIYGTTIQGDDIAAVNTLSVSGDSVYGVKAETVTVSASPKAINGNNDYSCHVLTCGADFTINYTNVPAAGRKVTFILINDLVIRTITFGTGFKSAGTVVGTAQQRATVTFESDGTSWCETGRILGLV